MKSSGRMAFQEAVTRYAQRFALGDVVPGSVQLQMESTRECDTCDYDRQYLTMLWEVTEAPPGVASFQVREFEDVGQVISDLIDIGYVMGHEAP